MRVLLVDPEPVSRDALRRAFSESGDQVRGVASLPEADRQLGEFHPEAVVAALDLGEERVFAFFEEAVRLDSRRALYALVDSSRLEDGVRAMARGAHDFLWRPISPGRVGVLRSRLESRREREGWIEQMRIGLARAEIASFLAGQSSAWKAALAAIEREAASDAAVLVTGEAGTEKEAAARAIHRLSRHGSEPFWTVPASHNFPPEGTRGTIFMAGIARAGATSQARILSRIERPSPLRLVLATDQDPRQAVGAGRLLPSLAEALESHVVHLPPLRERGEDVELLARRFLQEIDGASTLDPEAVDALRAYAWPGNVEELQNAMRRAASLADGPAIGATVVTSVLGLPLSARRLRRQKAPVVRVTVGESLANVERRLILNTLRFARGNKRKTAELLKLSLKTIYNKIKEYGVEH